MASIKSALEQALSNAGKKLTSFIGGAADLGKDFLDFQTQQNKAATQTAQNFGRFVSDYGTKAVNYFNPSSNAGQNFWSTPVAQGMATFQRENPLAPVFSPKESAFLNMRGP